MVDQLVNHFRYIRQMLPLHNTAQKMYTSVTEWLKFGRSNEKLIDLYNMPIVR